MIEDAGLLNIVFRLLTISISVEAITEIITSSSLFEPLRGFIKQKAYIIPPHHDAKNITMKWFDKLINCGYCASVWVSFPFSILICLKIVNIIIIDIFITTFLIHRLSNWIHVVYELVRKGRIKSVELNILESELDETDT